MSTQKVITFIDGNFSRITKFQPYNVIKEQCQNEIYYFYFIDDEGVKSLVEYDVYNKPTFCTIAEIEVEEINA